MEVFVREGGLHCRSDDVTRGPHQRGEGSPRECVTLTSRHVLWELEVNRRLFYYGLARRHSRRGEYSDAMNGWDQGNIAGVMGGLGPLATALFLQMVVERTEADSDQAHIDMLVSQHSSTPDRTAYLFDRTEANPIPVLVHDAQLLERAGADFLVLPCNTAHAFEDQIKEAVSVDVIDILGATVKEVERRSAENGVIAVLSTDGTRKTRLYQDELEQRGFTVVLPSEDDQALLMDVIYRQVKGGEPDNLGVLVEIIERLRAEGAQYFILGCTELPIAARELGILGRDDIVDSLSSLAEATIVRAGRELKK